MITIKNLISKIPIDKMLHFLFGVIIYTELFIITSNCFISLGSTILIAILKELYDLYIKESKIDVYDALSTIIGGVMQLIVFELNGF